MIRCDGSGTRTQKNKRMGQDGCLSAAIQPPGTVPAACSNSPRHFHNSLRLYCSLGVRRLPKAHTKHSVPAYCMEILGGTLKGEAQWEF